MNLIPKLEIEKKLNSIVVEAMAHFKEHMYKVESLHFQDSDISNILPHLYVMASIYEQLRPLHLKLDDEMPEFREIFQRLMMLQSTHEQMESLFLRLLGDADIIARRIKELPR